MSRNSVNTIDERKNQDSSTTKNNNVSTDTTKTNVDIKRSHAPLITKNPDETITSKISLDTEEDYEYYLNKKFPRQRYVCFSRFQSRYYNKSSAMSISTYYNSLFLKKIMSFY